MSNSSKKTIIIMLFIMGIAFYAGFFVHKKQYAKYPVENYDTEKVDSLFNSLLIKLDTMTMRNEEMLNNFKTKRNEIDSSYKAITKLTYIDDNDSLLKSVINLTKTE